jgi:hypothetical protein
MVERDGAGRDAAHQHFMQIAAVDVHVRAAVPPLAFGIEHDLVNRFASVPGAADVALRFDAGGDQRIFQPEPAQHLADIGGEDDAGADARERRRLLVHLHRKAGALQKASRRQTAEPGADDSNPHCARHAFGNGSVAR